MKNVIDVLNERGFIDAMTSEQLHQKVSSPVKVYCGFDPTADSLHLGNMVAIMGLAWFQRCGHTPVALVGGATGMIGDPSGRSSERSLLDRETISRNAQGIQKNLETILQCGAAAPPPLFLNNADWFAPITFIDFLRDIGKQFRLGPMLAKESVKARLQSEEGMSFTEFCYQLLQAYDFLHLYQTHQVSLQLGGSDQWGNITAGIDLIRKQIGQTAYGLTFPLLTRSDGQKFGKSAQGAIWLSPEKLSPYEFFQYLFRTADADVIQLMRLLTFMDMAEIRAYEGKMQQEGYEANSAQRRLAEEVTRIVHGEACLQQALQATQKLAPGSVALLDVATLEAAIACGVPSSTLPRQQVLGAEILDLFVWSGLTSSKGEARRLMRNGGAYLNNNKIELESLIIEEELLIDGRFLQLASGKKNKVVVSLI
jgi:tyrosyl-tRNA synthetase